MRPPVIGGPWRYLWLPLILGCGGGPDPASRATAPPPQAEQRRSGGEARYPNPPQGRRSVASPVRPEPAY
jgi:hypothetical protein